MSYPLNDCPTSIYYTLFFWFSQLVIDGRSEANRCERGLGGFFHFDEIVGFEDFFQSFATEVRNGKDAFAFEAGFIEDFFNIFWMVVIKTVGRNIGVVRNFFAEWIFFGTTSDEAGHFWKRTLVGNFNNGNAAWF